MFSVSSFTHLKNPDSKLYKRTSINILDSANITLFKPESGFRTYGGLITEADLSLVFAASPLKFDVKSYETFCSTFKLLIARRYNNKCLPMFFRNKSIIGSNYVNGLTLAALQQKQLQTASDSLILHNTLSTNGDSTSTAGRSTLSQDFSAFHQRNVVYCIRYADHPNYYYIGSTCAFITRLNQHASQTGLRPIVVFA